MAQMPSGNRMRSSARGEGDSMPANPMIRGRFRSPADMNVSIRDWMDDDTRVFIVCDEDELNRYEDDLGGDSLSVIAELEVAAVSGVMSGGGIRRMGWVGMGMQPPMMGGVGGMNHGSRWSMDSGGCGPGRMGDCRPGSIDPGGFESGGPMGMDGFGPRQTDRLDRTAMRGIRPEDQGRIVVIAEWMQNE